jgi:hypothetical protein
MPSGIRSNFKWTRRVLIGIAVLVAGVIGLDLYRTYTTRLPSCDHPQGVVTAQSLRDLPQILRDETLKRLPDLADRGSAFSAGCTGYGAHQRFATAARTGSRWVIGYEQGGFAYMVKVLTLDRLSTGTFVMSSHRYSSSESFCADINARLRNEPVPSDRRNVAERSL